MSATNLPRVSAIGDIRSGSSERVTLAADAGASAAAVVHKHQPSLRHEQDAAGA
jgi:thioredoxin reductase